MSERVLMDNQTAFKLGVTAAMKLLAWNGYPHFHSQLEEVREQGLDGPFAKEAAKK